MFQRILVAVGLLLLGLSSADPVAAHSTVYERGQSQCRQVALTFDAGSTAVSTRGIYDALAAHRARSTFFLTGQWIDDFPAFAAEVTALGHEVANHTYTHPDMTTITTAAMRQEMDTAEARIMAATGKDPRPFFRPPFGAYNNTVLDIVDQAGYPYTLMWDIDTLDWQHPPASVIVNRVLTRVVPGSIVLMHMGGNTTAQAVAQMLPELEKRGYQMVTIGEVLGLTRAGADFGGRVVYAQSGDTLEKVAGCFNTTAPILASANDTATPPPGTRLYVPLRDEATVRVNGNRVKFDTPAMIVSGRTLGGSRAIAEALGATVEWNDAAQRVTIRKGGTTIVMTIGSTQATVDGEPRTLDVPPYIEKGRTQAPIRFVAENLGATVAWDATSRTVLITQ